MVEDDRAQLLNCAFIKLPDDRPAYDITSSVSPGGRRCGRGGHFLSCCDGWNFPALKPKYSVITIKFPSICNQIGMANGRTRLRVRVEFVPLNGSSHT
jgi:hypothetical protein